MPGAVAPPGYVKNNIIPGVGFMNMVAYLKERGYSDDLAQTMAANIEANPDFRGNQELISGAQRWVAAKTPTAAPDPALGQIKLRDEYAAEQAALQAQGQKADSLASYFQRLGMSADQAVQLAHHALGRPDATATTPQEHMVSQTAEHPPIPPELYQSVLGAPQNIQGN